MSSTTRKSAYKRGVLDGAPFFFLAVPFAMLFGVVATEAGFDVAQVMGFSVVVIAGAAQFTAVQLMTEQTPIWLVLAASLAVNLRMAMYSASLQPHLGKARLWQRMLVSYVNLDQSYAQSMLKFEDEPDMPLQDKFLYFMGTVTIIWPAWYAFTLVGALVGNTIPAFIPLDFVMPAMFLSMAAPMLRSFAHLGAAVASIIVALIFSFLPSGAGLLLAAIVAMAVGAELERQGWGRKQ